MNYYCLVNFKLNIYHLPPGFLSLRKEEPLPELFPQTPVPSYSWPRSTQVADKIVSPSWFRSSLTPCPFSWCPLCHSLVIIVQGLCHTRHAMHCGLAMYFLLGFLPLAFRKTTRQWYYLTHSWDPDNIQLTPIPKYGDTPSPSYGDDQHAAVKWKPLYPSHTALRERRVATTTDLLAFVEATRRSRSAVWPGYYTCTVSLVIAVAIK